MGKNSQKKTFKSETLNRCICTFECRGERIRCLNCEMCIERRDGENPHHEEDEEVEVDADPGPEVEDEAGRSPELEVLERELVERLLSLERRKANLREREKDLDELRASLCARRQRIFETRVSD